MLSVKKILLAFGGVCTAKGLMQFEKSIQKKWGFSFVPDLEMDLEPAAPELAAPEPAKISRVKAWVIAMRLRTLPLAMASILGGLWVVFLPAWRGRLEFDYWIAVLTILTAVFLQVLSNFANDYGDAQNGADNAIREAQGGPARMVASGVITKQQMLQAIKLTAGLALASGLLLLWVAFFSKGFYLQGFSLLGVGVLCIIAAITYTAGPRPYGYVGLGDLSVYVFFGPVAVLGTAWLMHPTRFEPMDLFIAHTFGALATAVLNLNNMRDMDSDWEAQKLTYALKIGLMSARGHHILLVMSAIFAHIAYHNIGVFHETGDWKPRAKGVGIFFAPSYALLVKDAISIGDKKMVVFDPYLKRTALSSLGVAVFPYILLGLLVLSIQSK